MCLLILTIIHIIFDRNENEAVRDRIPVHSVDCTLVKQHTDCSDDEASFLTKHTHTHTHTHSKQNFVEVTGSRTFMQSVPQ